MKVSYIKGNKEYGIKYDWNHIKKRMKKLGIPDDVFNPASCPLEYCKYFVDVSERNIGKTTNWLLLGMIMNDDYGTVIQYVRQRDENITPKYTKDLFNTILEFDYVSKVTNGKYSSVFYKSRRWYYCNTDENGKPIDIAPEHFMFMCSVEKREDLKSGYNAPTGDLIIFDEFINKYYYPNEFCEFADLTKTIIRGRRSPIIAMLANTINPHSPYYNELMIYDEIQSVRTGESKLITTPKGTKIHYCKIGATIEKRKKNNIINQLFYGFSNPLLASITGDDEYAIKSYQHIPELDEEKKETVETISRLIYIYYNNKYVRLDVVSHSTLGICIYIHWATRTYDDSVILTAEYRYDNRYLYRYGTGNLERFLKRMIAENRIYYATNDVGCFVENYFNYVKMLKTY